MAHILFSLSKTSERQREKSNFVSLYAYLNNFKGRAHGGMAQRGKVFNLCERQEVSTLQASRREQAHEHRQRKINVLVR
jgi:hypothetical protein